MATLGKNGVLLVKQFDVTAYFREFEVGAMLDELEDTVFGSTNDKTFVPSIESGGSSMGGFWVGGIGAVDETLAGIFGGPTGAVTIAPDGSTVGNRCRLFKAGDTEYTTSAANTDLVGISVSLSHDSAMGMGIWLHDRVARTATGNGTSQDNGAATTNGWQATLHVLAVTGTTPNMVAKIQHSVDNSVWADLGTFTAATGVTSEFIKGTGTVNRYVRVIWTITGTTPSFTFAVGFARLYN